MSQSDYIKFKKTATVLKTDQYKMQPVLEQGAYDDYAQYSLETTIPNTKLRTSRLLPANKQNILDMELNVTNCAQFIMCSNTNTRPNRKPNTTQLPATTFRLNKVYTPTTCTFTNGFITRECVCSKILCKCGTNVCSQPTTNQSRTKYDALTFLM